MLHSFLTCSPSSVLLHDLVGFPSCLLYYTLVRTDELPRPVPLVVQPLAHIRSCIRIHHSSLSAFQPLLEVSVVLVTLPDKRSPPLEHTSTPLPIEHRAICVVHMSATTVFVMLEVPLVFSYTAGVLAFSMPLSVLCFAICHTRHITQRHNTEKASTVTP